LFAECSNRFLVFGLAQIIVFIACGIGNEEMTAFHCGHKLLSPHCRGIDKQQLGIGNNKHIHFTCVSPFSHAHTVGATLANPFNNHIAVVAWLHIDNVDRSLFVFLWLF
jgi:hypothetical protein